MKFNQGYLLNFNNNVSEKSRSGTILATRQWSYMVPPKCNALFRPSPTLKINICIQIGYPYTYILILDFSN